jgi:serine/threonine protein kinase
MAQVYQGWDTRLERVVAIKVIDARFRKRPNYAARFLREARAVATWRHPHVVQVYYADEEAGLLYFVMEYIDGQDLGQILSQHTETETLMRQDDVLDLGRAIASALDYAHGKGIIHRDLKPSNVMVAKDGRIVLTDFGLALHVDQGTLGETFGSAHYIAPEQAESSANAVPQSDLYSLAVILYELLTGRIPFDDPSSLAVAIKHITEPPPPPRQINPQLSQQTEEVILKALSKAPSDRYASGHELVAALEQALRPGPIGLQAQPPFPLSVSDAAPGGLSPLPVTDDLLSGLAFGPAPLEGRETDGLESQQEADRADDGHSRAMPLPPPPAAVASQEPPAGATPTTGAIAEGLGVEDTTLPPPAGDQREALPIRRAPVVEQRASTRPPLRRETRPMRQQDTPQVRSRRNIPWGYIGGGLVAGLLLAILAIVIVSQIRKDRLAADTTPVSRVVPTATNGGGVVPAPTRATPSPSVEQRTPSPTTPSPTRQTPTTVPPTTPPATETPPIPSPSPQVSLPDNYELCIYKRDDESLFLQNVGEDPFPLAPLRLGNDRGEVQGTAWGIATLAPGQCVAVWTDVRNPRPPKGVDCNLIGEPVVVEEKVFFWKNDFDVFYGEEELGSCRKKAKECTFEPEDD